MRRLPHKLSLIVVLISILTLILSTVAISPVALAMSTNEKASLMKEIELKLNAYDKEGAYADLKKLEPNMDFVTDPKGYLDVALKMMWIERGYQVYDKMIFHASDILNKADDVEYISYKIEAMDALANYDYYNFDNSSSLKKLDTMLALYSDTGNDGDLFQYYYGIAFLAVDMQEFDKATEYYSKALSILKSSGYESPIGVNLESEIHMSLADVYLAQNNYAAAVKEQNKAIALLSAKDYEAISYYSLQLAKSYYELGEMDNATLWLESARRAYEHCSDLFKTLLIVSDFDGVDAAIAHEKGQYKKSSDIYFKLYDTKQDPESVYQRIAAQKASSDFEINEFEKEINLLNELKVEKARQLEIQQKYLTAAIAAIALLFVLVVFSIFSLVWHKKQRKIMYLASITDQLTQIPNRRKIMEDFDRIQVGKKSIALLDVDNFKQINDKYGHGTGDEVLRQIAETISKSVRSQDEVGRYGGEEFLVILDTEDIQVAKTIVERIRMNVADIAWMHEGLTTTISIGLVHSEELVGDALLAEVDKRLYKSKEQGRNRTTIAIV